MPERDAASPDIIVHGHTHDTEIRQHGGVLFVGSGSPTFFLYRHGLGTVGFLDITADGAAASIVHL
jgi:predicted phosphodiesterase